ncbi:hypothetical protein Tco_1442632 [Tanacetum coccineum]
MEKNKILYVDNESWKESTDVGSELVDSDNEEVEDVFVEQVKVTGKHSTRNENNKKNEASIPYSETSNVALCVKGSRIILGWNLDDVDIAMIAQDDQVIDTRILLKAKRKELFCSFIYAHNRYTHKLALWCNLNIHKLYVRGRPWCLLGVFNASLHLEDKVEDIEVSDVTTSDLKKFTWN